MQLDDEQDKPETPETTQAEPGAFDALMTTDELLAAHAAMAETARSLGLVVETEMNFVAIETGRKACERLKAKIEAARTPGGSMPGDPPAKPKRVRKPKAADAAQPADEAKQEEQVTSKTKSKKAKTAKPKGTVKVVKAKSNGARHGSKTEKVAALLARKDGCTSKEVLVATGWPSVSMPAMAKNIGVKLRREKVKGQVTRYYGK